MPGGAMVTVNGDILEAASNIRDFKSEGFEWGYEGAGPRQLSFAILNHCFDEKTAFANYRAFLTNVIAEIQEDNWSLSEDEVVSYVEGRDLKQEEEDGIVYVDMDLETLLKKVRGEI